MATSAEAICNSALIKIGASTISSLTEDSVEAEACKEQYAKLRDELLRSNPWNFANKRAFLGKDEFTFLDADISVANNTITKPGHGKAEGDRFQLTSTGVLPAGLELVTDYFVSQVQGNTFKLSTTAAKAISAVEDVVDVTAAAGGGTHTYTSKPKFVWDFLYDLPSDYLRSVRLQPKSQKFIVEGEKLYSNDNEVFLIYIAKITDTTKFESSFDELLSLMISNELTYTLVHSSTLKATMQAELKLKLKDVRSFDAQEGTPEEFEANQFIDSRI